MSSAVRKLPLLLLSLLLSLFLLACPPADDGGEGDAAGDAGAEPVRVENAELGVAIADLDSFFEVASNEGDTIVLTPADETVAGTLTLSMGEPVKAGGVNLVAAVEEHKASLEERGGEFKGQRELGGMLGTAFYSRGHIPSADGSTTEEVVVHAMHPWGDRVLRLTYSYPAADDSAARIMEQQLVVFGEIEALDGAQPDASSAQDDAGGEG